MKLCLICNFQTAGEQDICPRDGSSMVTVGDDPLLGVVVEGRYRIESVIGQGSAGTVYKAVQELIGREVAIKVLHDYLVSDQEFIKRFTQEAKASSRLSHPNIITIYDFGVIPQGGRPYIAMDLLKGTPLSDALADRNHLEIEEAIPIFKQVCGALAEAHRQGVVHRDVKPENIVLVERSGQRLFPIVVDFGIARLVQEESDVARITRTGTVCGSPTYMSPEQCTSSKVDHRSDIYSLGVVIYETLTGEVPFLSDELVKVMAMHLSDPPKPLNQVREDLVFPQALEEVVYKSLAKNPDQRFQTMEEFSEALEESLKEPNQSMMPPAVQKRPEIKPGPLAQDEGMENARKQSVETGVNQNPSQNPSKQLDLASRALEHLRSSGVYEDPEGNPVTNTATGQRPYESVMGSATTRSAIGSRSNFGRGRAGPTVMERIQTVVQRGLLALLILIVAAGIFAVAANNYQPIAHYLPWKSATGDDPQTLYNQKKYEEALAILQNQKDKNKLTTKSTTDLFGKVCVQLAKRYAAEDRYDDAIAVLQQIPKGSTSTNDARYLLKRYRRILDNKQP
jgi:serine/threonine protein kinase